MKFWSDRSGELFCNGKTIAEKDLPFEFRDIYSQMWDQKSGTYEYLCEYKGQYDE